MRILFISILCLSACKPYKDSAPFTDSRINKPYCNDPSAINYNWDFPGVPDNATCIYPAQIFKGNYFYRDSIITATGGVGELDSFPITIIQKDSVNIEISGFCNTQIHTAKANRFFTFTIDSLTGNGQMYCSSADTIAGKGQKFSISDTTNIKFNYTILQNGVLTTHSGTATKL